MLIAITAAVIAYVAVDREAAPNALSIIAATLAFTLMAANLLLATRLRWIEALFGGLDRVYVAHRWSGIAALGFILVHFFNKPSSLGIVFNVQGHLLAGNAGKIGFYCLLVLILVSFFKRIPRVRSEIPYQFWRLSHLAMGPCFALIAFHQFFIKRPFSGGEGLALWLDAWSLIGLASYLYTLVAPKLRERMFTITAVEPHPLATTYTLVPEGASLRIEPGQFAFFAPRRRGLAEAHPFTIAGATNDGTIRVSIRALGDFTRKVQESLSVGDKVRVVGGYGHFSLKAGGDRQIWLAGGIGITPFLAFVRGLPPLRAGRQFHLVHCVSDEAEALGRAELEALSESRPDFSYVLHVSRRDGRLTAEKLASGLPFSGNGADLFFCGPAALRGAVVAGFKRAGIRLRQVKFEQFEFR